MKKPFNPLMLLLALLVSINVFSIPNLNSLPSATATIYLDFDGENVNSAYWNGGNTLNCAPSGFTDAQMIEIFKRVSEDYRPFNINITTDQFTYQAAPLNSRIQVIITPTSNWFTGVGGVAFIGSFNWGDDTPAFVFCDRLGPNSPKMVAECCAHESGHSLGLSHQSKYDGTCNLTATYNDGAGNGVNAWAPIMGNSYYRNMSGWNNGPTPYGCSNTQDNISIITSQNGFTYRADDYSDDININAGVFEFTNTNGIITRDSDKDAFTFSLTDNMVVRIDIKPFSINTNYDGANLDIKMLLYNNDKMLIRTYDPANAMNITADTLLNTGVYYMLIDGTGNLNTGDYGSLGSYTINGSTSGVLAVKKVALNGKIINNTHSLSWSIIADEAIESLTVQSSADGVHFTNLYNAKTEATSFSYSPFNREDNYYRIKVVTVIGQAAYSNTVLLKAVKHDKPMFTVANFVSNEISVHASELYQYQLYDVNGNTIVKGTGIPGVNNINVCRYPAGTYILKLSGKNQQQTERIIKSVR